MNERENEKPTRTKQTEEQYVKKVNNLKNTYYKSNSDLSFVQWMIQVKRLEYAPATWRLYRAALVYGAIKKGDDTNAELLKNTSPADGWKKGKTSSRKNKYVGRSDIKVLFEFLGKENSKYDIDIKFFIACGLYTGLRPSEWQYAKVIDNTLIIKNSKTTNGRGHGEFRRLIYSNEAMILLQTVEMFIKRIKEKTKNETNNFNKYLEACSKRLRVVCRKLWPRRLCHYTLYSARHQFSADMKAAGYNMTEIAAMMGHASIITATEHYGKKKRGRENNKLIAQPSPEDVARVERLNAHRQNRSDKKQKPNLPPMGMS